MFNINKKSFIRENFKNISKKLLIPVAYASLTIGCATGNNVISENSPVQYNASVLPANKVEVLDKASKSNDKKLKNISNLAKSAEVIKSSKKPKANKFLKKNSIVIKPKFIRKASHKSRSQQRASIFQETIIHALTQAQNILGLEKAPQQLFKILNQMHQEVKKELEARGLYQKEITTIPEAKEVLKIYGKIIDKYFKYKPTELISDVVKNAAADCDTKSLLTIALNELKPNPLPLYYNKVHAHALLCCQFGDPSLKKVFYGSKANAFNWEAASRGYDKSCDDNYYVEKLKWATVEQLKSGLYLKNISSRKKLISEYLLTVSMSKQAKERKDVSFKACKKAFSLDPNNVFVLTELANQYFKKGNEKTALKYFEKAERINPNYSWIYSRRAKIYEAKKDFKNAINEHSKSIKVYPNNPNFYTKRAFNYFQLGEYTSVIKDCKKAMKLKPKNSYATYLRGIAYYKQKKYSQAVDLLKKALNINPKVARQANLLLGYSYYKINELEKAKYALKKHLTINNRDIVAKRILKIIHRKQANLI